MITGFNTDIKYNGVTYHVQTEDKGLKTPLILSLVYHRGTILASKRSPYDDLLNGTLDEKELAKRLQRQHKLICAAIQAGRVDDLKRMNMKESAEPHKGLIAHKEVVHADKDHKEAKAPHISKPEIKTRDNQFETVESFLPPPEYKTGQEPQSPIQKPDPAELRNLEAPAPLSKPFTELSAEEVWEMPIAIVEESIEEFIFDGVSIVEEEIILPAEAVEIITDSHKIESADSDKLAIRLIDEQPFKGGQSHALNIAVGHGKAGGQIKGANIMVKVLGSSFRPLIFHAKTDRNGVAAVTIQIPSFSRGRAAVLIKAMTGTEETELRKIIQPG